MLRLMEEGEEILVVTKQRTIPDFQVEKRTQMETLFFPQTILTILLPNAQASAIHALSQKLAHTSCLSLGSGFDRGKNGGEGKGGRGGEERTREGGRARNREQKRERSIPQSQGGGETPVHPLHAPHSHTQNLLPSGQNH